ncbi:PI-PLC X domain-containing protein 2-like [Saccostrea cucullata]|uniref:PI-PLC X domain-containing protein 2-like n=1 Tax=Saccostrea cuccullata TaxID=36930 RepID=UPI002ED55756
MDVAQKRQKKCWKDWMSQLPSHLQKAPLNKLAIPGSHNSFSYSLDPQSQVAPDQSKEIQAVVHMFGAPGRDVIHRWSITQNLTVEQQLNSGIRYFDIRISRHSASGKVCFVHGLHGADVIPCLQDIKKFLDSHPKEIAILDFNHLYEMEACHHTSLLETMTEIFGNKICPFLNMECLTLEMLWESELQVIILYHNEIVSDNPFFWSGSLIRSPWANSTDISHVLSFLDKHKRENDDKERFFCWQGVLTPNAQTIISHFSGSLKDVLASRLAPFFVTWVKNGKSVNCKHGIFIMDFVEMADFIPTVIDLNY